MRFGDVKVETKNDQHVFDIHVCLNDLNPDAVRVELYADGGTANATVLHVMKRTGPVAGAACEYVYSAAVSAARPFADYTARVIPHREGIAVPLEESHILWQR